MGGGCASSGLRRLPSEADLLANAQISQWPGINPITACPNTGSPITTTFASSNGGSNGGAVYFSFEALAGSGGVTITDIDLNSDAAAGTAVSIDVYVQPNTGSCSYDLGGDWILRTTGTGVAAGSNNPTPFALNSPLEFADGCCQGIAIVANGFGHRYTDGATNPATYSNGEVTITAGGASNAPVTAPLFEPRIVNTNIHYTLGGGLCGPPLTTTFASNNGGGADGAVYFSLEALAGSGGVTISDIDLNCNSATLGNAVSIDVYVQPNGGSCSYDPSGVWVLKTSGTGVNAGTDNPTNFVLSSPLELGEGCCLGVAIVANGFAHRYITGSSNPEVYSSLDLRLTAGAASNTPFSASFFEPRVVNARINYLLGGSCSDTAVANSYGNGCVETFTSFYEVMTQAGMDLSGLELWGTATAGGHQVQTRPATIMPIGSLGAPTALALGDDDQTTAGTLGLSVGSNGWVARGAGNSNGFVPDVATMLANPSEGYYAWTDLQPNATGSGLVHYEESGTQWMVTYDGVFLWNTTDPVTIQFRGDESNGNFVIAFGALGSTGPEDWLVGHSGAGASADPGPRDLSQATLSGFLMADADQAGLELAAVNSPVLGGAFQLQTTNIPATAVFHVGILGLGQVTAPLAFAFPAANLDCSLYATVDVVLGPQFVLGGPGSWSWTGIDLSSVSLLGANVYFQAATLDLSGLSDTVRTSNGVEITTGLY
ncbi:MAG: hypothetical protein VYD05_02110, partial [Planctomycetota bacterium]|nr:hypothetical protein [Planctomycetota bacterium]